MSSSFRFLVWFGMGRDSEFASRFLSCASRQREHFHSPASFLNQQRSETRIHSGGSTRPARPALFSPSPIQTYLSPFGIARIKASSIVQDLKGDVGNGHARTGTGSQEERKAERKRVDSSREMGGWVLHLVAESRRRRS